MCSSCCLCRCLFHLMWSQRHFRSFHLSWCPRHCRLFHWNSCRKRCRCWCHPNWLPPRCPCLRPCQCCCCSGLSYNASSCPSCCSACCSSLRCCLSCRCCKYYCRLCRPGPYCTPRGQALLLRELEVSSSYYYILCCVFNSLSTFGQCPVKLNAPETISTR